LLKKDLKRFREITNRSTPNQPLVILDWISILSPRFAPMLLFRISFACQRMRLSPLAKLFSLMNFTFFGIEIAIRCKIGGGLFLPHTQGTVIGAWSIGENATIYQGVTIGAKELDFDYSQSSRPTLGQNVLVGAGAIILGGIIIADSTRIGAQSLVMESLPEGSRAFAARARHASNPEPEQP